MGDNLSVRVFPVIHMGLIPKSNFDQIFTAYDSGADGVFLISHYLSAVEFSKSIDEMDELAKSVYENDLARCPPDFAIGVNYLGVNSLPATDFFKPWMSMLWSDNSAIYVDDFGSESKIAKSVIGRIRKTGDINSEFFGGIAFKYQIQPGYEELYRLLSVACSIDGYVVTTSGDQTGFPPSPEKIKLFREIMPVDKRLAIASGASVGNVTGLKQAGVTDFLVATSICVNDILNSKKLREFVLKIREN